MAFVAAPTQMATPPPRYTRPPSNRPPNRPIMCYRCGEYGHYQGRCHLPEGSPPCQHCPENRDHYSRDCPKQRPSSSSAPPTVDFTFPTSHLISVSNFSPEQPPASHVISAQASPAAMGVLTRAQRATLGLGLDSPLCCHGSHKGPLLELDRDHSKSHLTVNPNIPHLLPRVPLMKPS